MFYLNFSLIKNFRLILTTKFLILITKNGIIKFHTNIYNLYFYKQILYLSLQTKNVNLINLNFSHNYLINFYNGLFNLIFPEKLNLILQGIGYKFVFQHDILKIRIGYSHFIDYKLPKDIYISLITPTILVLYSNNKLILTKIAAFLKSQKKVNIYKGAGIFYQIESINLKKKILIKIKMLNNLSVFLKNKYFFALCFYLKKNLTNNYTTLFLGYKNNYLILNIPVLIYILKLILKLTQQIAIKNGTFLFLATNNKILDYIIQQNCLKTNNSIYLQSTTLKHTNLLKTLSYFPDLVISTNTQINKNFLNKLNNYNIPTICMTSNVNLLQQSMYTLILNNQSLYSNLLFYTLIFNQIRQTKKKLGVQFLITK